MMRPLEDLSFAATARGQIAANVRALESQAQPLGALRSAAVALVVVESRGQLIPLDLALDLLWHLLRRQFLDL